MEGARRGGMTYSWITCSFMLLFHVGAVAAFFNFTWSDWPFLRDLLRVAGLGIGMAYHRLLTHRSYRTPKAVEYFLTICATLALEGGPLFWVATHRQHHQHSDADNDPHTPCTAASGPTSRGSCSAISSTTT